MDPNYHYTFQLTRPSSQATPLVLSSTYYTSQAAPTGAPRTLQPTYATPQVIPPVPPALGNASLAVYPGAFPYHASYNNNWGPQQEHLLLQHATQMAEGHAGLTAPPDSHYRCLWDMNGIICSHVAVDFDELMLHLGREHDVQGTAARKIDCQWPTERGICRMRYRRDGFRRHVGTHVGLSVSCGQCGKSFSREDTLRGHTKKVHGEKEG